MESYKVIGEFTDKHTGQKYMPDDEVEFTKARADEILKVGELIIKVKKSKSVTETENPGE
jgi:hypothetical protein